MAWACRHCPDRPLPSSYAPGQVGNCHSEPRLSSRGRNLNCARSLVRIISRAQVRSLRSFGPFGMTEIYKSSRVGHSKVGMTNKTDAGLNLSFRTEDFPVGQLETGYCHSEPRLLSRGRNLNCARSLVRIILRAQVRSLRSFEPFGMTEICRKFKDAPPQGRDDKYPNVRKKLSFQTEAFPVGQHETGHCHSEPRLLSRGRNLNCARSLVRIISRAQVRSLRSFGPFGMTEICRKFKGGPLQGRDDKQNRRRFKLVFPNRGFPRRAT
jgi:hypothetical protein